MRPLSLWEQYSRRDIHGIFSPNSTFTPQAGTWGLQGIVRIPERPGDFVFFVTFGHGHGDHIFDESITDDGVLSWESQPKQKLDDPLIRELIDHDDRINNIYLFLRPQARLPYWYLGTLGYLTHDSEREAPVHFQWQLLDWPASPEIVDALSDQILPSKVVGSSVLAVEDEQLNGLITVPIPAVSVDRTGVNTSTFRARKIADRASQDTRNRALGKAGEEAVVKYEKDRLTAAGRSDLADLVKHSSIEQGDGLGYDVLSYNVDGSERFIEVKTTGGGAETDFFVSPNELAFSLKRTESYYLYRLFEFDSTRSTGKMFVLQGNLNLHVSVLPTAYRAKISSFNPTHNQIIS